jgi:putative endonuclease
MEKYNRLLGEKGEALACKYLARRGYKILEKNYSCRTGEIDIIASKKDYIVFVEVKTRLGDSYGTPASAVSYVKRKRIIQIASAFMQNFEDRSARFDIIEIIGSIKNNRFYKKNINHIKNAFWEE